VIRASALNNDGSDKVSFSAPSVSGQSAAVMEAMALAGVEPEQIGYIEAHATGTLLGDPIEIAALTEAYTALAASPLPIGGVPIGSVKSNVGHLNEAAGIAGLIKAVLALEREAIPATIGVDTVNPRLGIESTPFAVNTGLRPWPRDPDRPRFAGVTSLGIGGSNVHAVVGEAPVTEHEVAVGRPRIVVWSARTEAARDQARTRVAEYFDRTGEDLFADATATLAHGRTPHAVRGAVVCSSAREAAEALSGNGSSHVLTAAAATGTGVGWLFPGQGAHRPRMAAGLYGVVRPFTIAMDECLDAFEREGAPLLEHWLADDPEPAAFADPLVVQPLLFSVEYALARMWQAWGPAPVALLGHSVGELAAATLAGVFDVADAVRLVAIGGMLAVAAEESTVRELLTDRLAIAAVNGPKQTVASGPDDALAELAARLSAAGIGNKALPVSHAFHHPEWTAAVTAFGKAFDGVRLHAPTIPLYSGLTGALVTGEQAVDPAFWTEQLTAPVRFASAADALLADAELVLVEVGPGRTLSQLVRHRDGATPLVISTLPDGADDHHAALTAAARLWVAGSPIDWAATGQQMPRTRVALPAYPYERVRHWIEAPAEGAPAPTPQPICR
jgi:acyl transferase domain-containing protein